jgi:ribonuclease J
MMDLVRLGEIGRDGVTLLLCESTNAERNGFTPSERIVGGSLERIFLTHKKNRLVIATFSSNVHRVQQIIDASVRHGRRVAVVGRSMLNVTQAAAELGYMDIPEGTLIDTSEMKRYRPEDITLITTGSQGEPMSALYRMAFAEHDRVKLSPSDVVVLSATAIPGNEKLVGKIINALISSGVKVISDPSLGVHVSGHACQEELKLFHALTKPKYFMPIHGEARHLYAHKEIAEFMGIAPSRIFVSEIGKVLEIDRKGARFAGTVPSGKVLVDGSGVGDVGSVVLRDRKLLAQDGLIVVVTTVDPDGREIISGPDIISRGFVYVRDNEEMMNEARRIATECINRCMEKRSIDWMQIKGAVRDQLSRYFYGITKRKPMILPVIMNI